MNIFGDCFLHTNDVIDGSTLHAHYTRKCYKTTPPGYIRMTVLAHIHLKCVIQSVLNLPSDITLEYF